MEVVNKLKDIHQQQHYLSIQMGVSHDIADISTCDVNYPLLLSHNFCIFTYKIIASPIYTNWCFLMTSVFFLRVKPINYSSLGGCGLHLGEVKSLRPLNSWEEQYVFVYYQQLPTINNYEFLIIQQLREGCLGWKVEIVELLLPN